MNIKKLAASLMMLSLCTVGVENVSAAASARDGAARLRENVDPETLTSKEPRDIHGNHILPVGSTNAEDIAIVNLYGALIDKDIFLLKEEDVVPKGVQGLEKYLRQLVRQGITADTIRGFRSPGARAKVVGAVGAIERIYHENATQKIADVREGISASTLCLTQITELTRTLSRDIVNSETRDELVNRFARALATLNFGAINANFDGDTGASATTLTAHRQAVENLWQVVVALARLTGDKIGELQTANEELHDMQDALKRAMRRENGTMLCLHIIYKVYCAYLPAGSKDFFDSYEDVDPATPANGSKSIRERYNAWVTKAETRAPKNGDSYTEENWNELLRKANAADGV